MGYNINLKLKSCILFSSGLTISTLPVHYYFLCNLIEIAKERFDSTK